MEERVVTFRSAHRMLLGILHEPAGASGTGIVILVGGPQYRVGSHRMFVRMAREFARRRYPVLRFDFAGMGDSEGIFAGFEHLDGDVRAATDALSAACPALERIVLVGLCDGATAAAYYASTDGRVRGAVLLNPWVHTETGQAKTYLWHYYPRRLLQRDFWRALIGGEVSVAASIADFAAKLARLLPGRKDGRAVAGSFIDRMRAALEVFRGEVLLVASEKDFTAAEFTALLSSDPRWAKVRKTARLVTLDEADHTLSRAVDMQKFCSAVCDWLSAVPALTGEPAKLRT